VQVFDRLSVLPVTKLAAFKYCWKVGNPKHLTFYSLQAFMTSSVICTLSLLLWIWQTISLKNFFMFLTLYSICCFFSPALLHLWFMTLSPPQILPTSNGSTCTEHRQNTHWKSMKYCSLAVVSAGLMLVERYDGLRGRSQGFYRRGVGRGLPLPGTCPENVWNLTFKSTLCFKKLHPSTTNDNWPTVLSVEPLVQCVVCLSSVCRLSVVCLWRFVLWQNGMS